MSHDLEELDESVCDGLLVDSEGWAFGGSFEDPLAGVDLTVPDGVDPVALARTCLALGDDALVLGHRLSEWCSRAPDLEEDVALANMALDLLGQARLLLTRAAAADPSVVPALPEGSPAPAEDALAYFRDAQDFRCHRLVEVAGGDFGRTVARLLLCSTVRLAACDRFRSHPDPVLAAIAAKAVPELTYHRDWSARWCVVLAHGTEESRRRLVTGLEDVWPLHHEHAAAYDVGQAVDAVLDQVLGAAGLERPARGPRLGGGLGGGPGGGHTEALSLLLAEMQSVARAHPRGRW